jgi:hypothetical protein
MAKSRNMRGARGIPGPPGRPASRARRGDRKTGGRGRRGATGATGAPGPMWQAGPSGTATLDDRMDILSVVQPQIEDIHRELDVQRKCMAQCKCR